MDQNFLEQYKEKLQNLKYKNTSYYDIYKKEKDHNFIELGIQTEIIQKIIIDDETQTSPNTSEIYSDIELIDENNTLKKINAQNEKKFNELKEMFQNSIIQNNEKFNKIEKAYNDLETKFITIKKDHEALKKDNEALKKDNEALKKDIIKLKNDFINNLVYSIIEKSMFKISIKEAYNGFLDYNYFKK